VRSELFGSNLELSTPGEVDVEYQGPGGIGRMLPQPRRRRGRAARFRLSF
jgi:hypothetical protein